MYDRESFQAAWDECRLDTLDEVRDSCRQAWRLGLQTPWKGGTLQGLARTCLDLARDGLDRQQLRRGQERSESCFLDGLDDLIEGGQTLAEQLLQNWHGDRQEKFKKLVGHCGFFDVASNRSSEDCANAQFSAGD
jgi:glutamate--cysteine ligase